MVVLEILVLLDLDQTFSFLKDQIACCSELNFVGEVDSNLEESEFDISLVSLFFFYFLTG